jgi:hypothetical protein
MPRAGPISFLVLVVVRADISTAFSGSSDSMTRLLQSISSSPHTTDATAAAAAACFAAAAAAAGSGAGGSGGGGGAGGGSGFGPGVPRDVSASDSLAFLRDGSLGPGPGAEPDPGAPHHGPVGGRSLPRNSSTESLGQRMGTPDSGGPTPQHMPRNWSSSSLTAVMETDTAGSPWSPNSGGEAAAAAAGDLDFLSRAAAEGGGGGGGGGRYGPPGFGGHRGFGAGPYGGGGGGGGGDTSGDLDFLGRSGAGNWTGGPPGHLPPGYYGRGGAFVQAAGRSVSFCESVLLWLPEMPGSSCWDLTRVDPFAVWRGIGISRRRWRRWWRRWRWREQCWCGPERWCRHWRGR